MTILLKKKWWSAVLILGITIGLGIWITNKTFLMKRTRSAHQDQYWTTIVGIERDQKTISSSFLAPLHSSHLLGWKFLSSKHPIISNLDLPWPSDELLYKLVSLLEYIF